MVRWRRALASASARAAEHQRDKSCWITAQREITTPTMMNIATTSSQRLPQCGELFELDGAAASDPGSHRGVGSGASMR